MSDRVAAARRHMPQIRLELVDSIESRAGYRRRGAGGRGVYAQEFGCLGAGEVQAGSTTA